MKLIRTIFFGLVLCFTASNVSAEFGEPTLVKHPGFVNQQGPENAKGVIIWSPGYGGSGRHPRASNGGMPHVLDWLYGHGWDVYYMQRRGGIGFEDRPRHARAIVNAVSGLRAAGYENIVLGGQSSGGTYSLIAAQENIGLHAILLTGSGPSLSGKGRTPLYVDFLDLLAGVQTPRLIVAHFAEDETIGQRSRSEVQAALSANRAIDLNIFEPAGIAGHSGAFLSTFSRRFGDCLLRFLEPNRRPSGRECNGR